VPLNARPSRNTGQPAITKISSPTSQVQVKTLLANFVDAPLQAATKVETKVETKK
jgi:hypothetical protein